MAADRPRPSADDKPNWPVRWIAGDQPDAPLEEGVALCLSGGGYRAMLFHVGAIWRLNELGYLDRAKLMRVSSVSGGSLTAGVLAMNWKALGLEAQTQVPVEQLKQVFVKPIRDQAHITIDISAGLTGLIDLGRHGSHLSDFYSGLFGETKLAELSDQAPTFIFNSTSLQTGELMRFTKAYMADWRIGKISNPDRLLREAVAASSSWPPVLSPTKLRVDPNSWDQDGRGELFEDPYNSQLVLTDGGVYDNLGLETAFKKYKTVLVSDADGLPADDPTPHTDWPLQTYRVLMLIYRQVASLRKRQLISAFQTDHSGTYWSMGSEVSHYPADELLPCPVGPTLKLAQITTRFQELDDDVQDRIINWGYAICDVAMRSWMGADQPPPKFPYPQGVG